MIEVKALSELEYTQFTEAYPHHNILQLYRWPLIKPSWQATYWGVYDQGQLVLTTLVLERTISHFWKMAYLARGPVGQLEHLPYLQALLDFLVEYFRGCSWFKVDLNYAQIHGQENSLLPVIDQYLMTQGFRKIQVNSLADSIQAQIHANIYLTDNDLSKSYSNNAYRRLIAARNKFVEVETVGVEGLPWLSKFVSSTETKQGIKLRDQEYFQKIFETFPEQCVLSLAFIRTSVLQIEIPQLITEWETKITTYKSPQKIAALQERLSPMKNLLTLYHQYQNDVIGDKFYVAGLFSLGTSQRLELLYAGTLPEFEQLLMPMAMLYDHQFRHAQEQGMVVASMGGIENNFQGGLYNFKKIFRPTLEEYLGEYDYVYQPLRYQLFQWLWKWKKRH